MNCSNCGGPMLGESSVKLPRCLSCISVATTYRVRRLHPSPADSHAALVGERERGDRYRARALALLKALRRLRKRNEPPIVPKTRYVAWNHSFGGSGISVVKMDDAIRSQHDYAAIRRLPRYANDNAALLDFMAQRGAWTTDRADGRMDDDE